MGTTSVCPDSIIPGSRVSLEVAKRFALEPSSFLNMVDLIPNDPSSSETQLINSIFGVLLIVGKLINFSKISIEDKFLLAIRDPYVFDISGITKKFFSFTVSKPITTLIIVNPSTF